jgi:hypothetical protein
MNSQELLAKWQEETCRAQTAHFYSAARLERLKNGIGILVITLSTIAGSSVFATLQNEPDARIKIAIAVTSLAAALLAGIQTYLGHSQRAEKHRLAAIKFGALKKEIEVTQTTLTDDPEEWKKISNSLLEIRNHLSEESPTIPEGIWAKVGERVDIDGQSSEKRILLNSKRQSLKE